MQKKWEILSQVDSLIGILPALLKNRGIDSGEEARQFLAPAQAISAQEVLAQTEQFFDSAQLQKAVMLTQKAIREQKTIIIHGDYDVDGLTSTAILWETLYRDLDYQNTHPFIPHRLNHGYGVSFDSVNEITARWCQTDNCLLITVDCGITAQEAIQQAQSRGIQVIVIDHHELPQNLPTAEAILHSTRSCAATLAWLFANALTQAQTPHYQLELVALGILADLQPLLGLNRCLTQLGLQQLNSTQRIGLQELYRAAGTQNRLIGPYEVGFIIGPRLNAMGRLEHALESLRLLCTRSRQQARQLALELNRVNQKRQKMTDEAFLDASGVANQQFVVADNESWHEGIIGLIASKLAEEHNRPAIVISRGNKFSKGSVRSVNNLNVIQALRQIEGVFVDLGGHAAAAGFTIETRRINELKEKLAALDLPELKQKTFSPTLKIDLELKVDWIDFELIRKLAQMEPYGIGNPRPVFLTRNLVIADLKTVGADNKHLKLNLQTETFPLNAIGFNLGEQAQKLAVGQKVDLVYSLAKDTYNGPAALQLKLKDLRPSP